MAFSFIFVFEAVVAELAGILLLHLMRSGRKFGERIGYETINQKDNVWGCQLD